MHYKWIATSFFILMIFISGIQPAPSRLSRLKPGTAEVEGMLDGIGKILQSLEDCYKKPLTSIDDHFKKFVSDPINMKYMKKVPPLKLLIRVSSCLVAMVGVPKLSS